MITRETAGYSFDQIKNADSEVAEAIQKEIQRQNSHIELIASENLTSKDVREAMGSSLTNKYAEGYPVSQYYGGCQYVDVVENLARERTKRLFRCEYVNVKSIREHRQTWLWSIFLEDIIMLPFTVSTLMS